MAASGTGLSSTPWVSPGFEQWFPTPTEDTHLPPYTCSSQQMEEQHFSSNSLLRVHDSHGQSVSDSHGRSSSTGRLGLSSAEHVIASDDMSRQPQRRSHAAHSSHHPSEAREQYRELQAPILPNHSLGLSRGQHTELVATDLSLNKIDVIRCNRQAQRSAVFTPEFVSNSSPQALQLTDPGSRDKPGLRSQLVVVASPTFDKQALALADASRTDGQRQHSNTFQLHHDLASSPQNVKTEQNKLWCATCSGQDPGCKGNYYPLCEAKVEQQRLLSRTQTLVASNYKLPQSLRSNSFAGRPRAHEGDERKPCSDKTEQRLLETTQRLIASNPEAPRCLRSRSAAGREIAHERDQSKLHALVDEMERTTIRRRQTPQELLVYNWWAPHGLEKGL